MCEQVLLSGGMVAVQKDVRDCYFEFPLYHEMLIWLMEFDLIALWSSYSCSPKTSTVVGKKFSKKYGYFTGAHRCLMQTFILYSHGEGGRRRRHVLPVPEWMPQITRSLFTSA